MTEIVKAIGQNLQNSLLKTTVLVTTSFCLVGLAFVAHSLHGAMSESERQKLMSISLSSAYSQKAAIENHLQIIRHSVAAGDMDSLEGVLTTVPLRMSFADNWVKLNAGEYVRLSRDESGQWLRMAAESGRRVPVSAREWNFVRFPSGQEHLVLWKENLTERVFLGYRFSNDLFIFAFEPSIFAFLLKGIAELNDGREQESTLDDRESKRVARIEAVDTLLVTLPRSSLLSSLEKGAAPADLVLSSNPIKFHNDYFKGRFAHQLQLPNGSFEVEDGNRRIVISRMDISGSNLVLFSQIESVGLAARLEQVVLNIGVPILFFFIALIVVLVNLIYFKRLSVAAVRDAMMVDLNDLRRRLSDVFQSFSSLSDWGREMRPESGVDFQASPSAWPESDQRRVPSLTASFPVFEVSSNWQGKLFFDRMAPSDLLICAMIEASDAVRASVLVFLENQISTGLLLLSKSDEETAEGTSESYANHLFVFDGIRSRLRDVVESQCRFFDIIMVTPALEILWQWGSHGWRMVESDNYVHLLMGGSVDDGAEVAAEDGGDVNWRLVSMRFAKPVAPIGFDETSLLSGDMKTGATSSDEEVAPLDRAN